MHVEFEGEIWYWRGPAPYYFVTVPAQHGDEIKVLSRLVTYGWGMIPATARIGETEWTTALFPKNGTYLVPLKDRVRSAEHLEEGGRVTVHLDINT